LRDPALCERILADFDRAGVVGEETNKLTGYLATISRKLTAPLGVVIQSTSAAGKSSLMDAVLSFVPEEERVQYSAMTGQSLYYMGEADLQHKVLAIAEEEGASNASYALKLLQSEGELTIASTGKDPTSGRLVTQEYRVTGPVMVMMTTTAIELDEELLNRCIVLTVDDGRAQTRAIHQRQREAETLEGMLAASCRQAVMRLHQNAQRLLKPLTVVNPFAAELSFADHATRTRRDHKKYLTLIRTIALLHQHQREVKEASQDGATLRYIEATREDIAIADRLSREVLSRSMDELAPQTRRVLEAIAELVREEAEKQGIERCDVRFTQRDVRERVSLGVSQLKVHLSTLVEHEYLLVHRHAHRQRHLYELACSAGAGEHHPFVNDESTYDANRPADSADRPATGRSVNRPVFLRDAELLREPVGAGAGDVTGAREGGTSYADARSYTAGAAE
jgi:DNA primase